MAFYGVIPARYASTRFPGKPLALIHGKPMIQWVYERSLAADLQRVVVATDDQRLMDAVRNFGGEAVMTSPHHQSGTERCAEVADTLRLSLDDVVVNIQGDEPYIRSEAINLLIRQFQDDSVQIATLAKEFLPEENPENPNMVKVTFSVTGKALTFSRSPLPYYRNTEVPRIHYKHIGIYAYRYGTLRDIVQLPLSTLENAEKLGVDPSMQAVAVLLIGYTDSAVDATSSASTREALDAKTRIIE